MSTTTNMGLLKHDNPSTNTNKFDVDDYLNGNWDTIDEYCGTIKTDVDNNTSQLKSDTTDITNLKSSVETNTSSIKSNTSAIETNTAKIANKEPLHTYYRYDITEDIDSDTAIDLDFTYTVGADNLVVLFCGERLIKDVEYEETSESSITLLFSISYIEDYDKYLDFIVKTVDEEDSDE